VILAAVGTRLIQLDGGEAGLKWFYAGWIGTKAAVIEAKKNEPDAKTRTATAKAEEVLAWLEAVVANYEVVTPPANRREAVQWAKGYMLARKNSYPEGWMRALVDGELVALSGKGGAKTPGEDKAIEEAAATLWDKAGTEKDFAQQTEERGESKQTHPRRIAMPWKLFPAEEARDGKKQVEEETTPNPPPVIHIPKNSEKETGRNEESEPWDWQTHLFLWVLLIGGVWGAAKTLKRFHLGAVMRGGIEYESRIRLNDGMSADRRDDAQEAMEMAARLTLDYHGAKVAAAITGIYRDLEGEYGDFVNIGVAHSLNGQSLRVGMHPIDLKTPLERLPMGKVSWRNREAFLSRVAQASPTPLDEDLRFGKVTYTRTNKISVGRRTWTFKKD
jgi:hypothetical protein